MTRKRTRSKWRQRRLVLSIIGALMALGLAAGFALADEGSGSPTPTEVEPTASIDSNDLATFGILRRTQEETDAVPQQTPLVFAGPSGANIELARRVHGLGTGTAWVFPGRGSVCLLANGAGSCVADAAAAAGELIDLSGSAAESGVELLSGLVPDGVTQVDVHLADGTSETIPIHENVYTASFKGRVTAVTLDSPNESTTLRVDGPPSNVSW